MSDCCNWLSRSTCCRRHPQQAYIYLYAPNMSNPSSSSSHCCLICLLFILCLAFVAVLSAVVIYHLHVTNLSSLKNTYVDPRIHSFAERRQLPKFVNIKINPCENFYGFVCDKKASEQISDEDDYRLKWRHIQHDFHEKLMSNNVTQLFSKQNEPIVSFYQMCENQSPELLLDELERYFVNLRYQEPYKSYLTLFNQTKSHSTSPLSIFSLESNPFIRLEQQSDESIRLIRLPYRSLPSPAFIFSNLTILNKTALNHLTQFDHDYRQLLLEESTLRKSYEQEYDQDSLIIKRILTYPNYDQCHSNLNFNQTNGLEKLTQLFHHFLSSRLNNFNTKSIDKQIRILDQIIDNHTLVEHLQRILINFKTIDDTVYSTNKNSSCLIKLLEKLLEKKFHFDELNLLILDRNQTFTSNDWPYLFILNDYLFKNISLETLINYVYFHSYRQFIYPYYQPHLQHNRQLDTNLHSTTIQSSAFTFQIAYPNLSCHIESCFDIFNCYHPSLFNRLVENMNQSLIEEVKVLVENLFNRFRLLTEQSDNLYSNERQLILNQINQIQLRIGHYSTQTRDILIKNFSSYIEFVRYYSSNPFDTEERSYFIEPIYYPSNKTLFLPFSFLSQSKTVIEYELIRLLLKIFRLNLSITPFHIECLVRSLDDEYDYSNQTKLLSNDEHLTYLLLRSKFLHEQEIVLDEYLWPFMSANSLMKHFLIDYTVKNYCSTRNGWQIFQNNTYLNDDIYLIFHCQQASLIKQSKCTVI